MSARLSMFSITLLFICFLVKAEEYRFVSIQGLAEQRVGEIIIPKLYSKLDISIQIDTVPGKRAEFMASSGYCDGEIMRVYQYGINNPNLIRVPTPYYHLETALFVKSNQEIKIDSLDGLKNYRVAVVRGVKHTDEITKDLNNVYVMNNSIQLMKYLQSGRADIAITSKTDGLLSLKQLGETTIEIIDPPFTKLELFHYIHHSHRHLVPQIDSVIREAKLSGELNSMIKAAESEVFAISVQK